MNEASTDTAAEPSNGRALPTIDRDAQFRRLVENVSDQAMFLVDPDETVASWNAGAERMHGYQATEIVGRPFALLFPEDEQRCGGPARVLALTFDGGRFQQEGWRARKDGTRFWVEASTTTLYGEEGQHLGYSVVTRDLTDRKGTEAMLRESEERFRLLVESVQDYAIFLLDPGGNIVSWNAGAERIKGYTRGEIIGKHFSIFYSDEDRGRMHPDHELAQALEHRSYAEEGWRIRKDGARFWASVVITALRDQQGRHVGFAKVTRDMTERRMAEQRLRELNEDLEQRVQARTADLSVVNKELEAFSYSVSHDLRAPLRALDGFSKLLLEQACPTLSEQEQHYLRRIRLAAQRMSQLTDALLMLSRLTRSPVNRERLDISALAGNVAAELQQANPQHAVQLSLTPGLAAPADAHLMRIVFENLLGNAWKFTRKTSEPLVEVGARSQDGETIFFVRDNGAGFDPALRNKLFVPFRRLHRAEDYEGSGIGLATVRRIIERHGGRIWAEAAKGRGATFSFTLGRGDDRT